MSEKKLSNLPLGSDDHAENELWNALREIEAEEPSARLRQDFYRSLEQASRPAPMARLSGLLGLSSNVGWLTAAACVLLGLGSGQLLSNVAGDDDLRFAALEQNVAMLNRSLILDRLENGTASKRLRGVLDAATVAGHDEEIAQALLLRATEDRVPSVRTAAITALGPQLNSPPVSMKIMQLLQQSESPLVQLALVDLVLRNGSRQQLSDLLELADSGALDPDITRHVFTALGREVA